MRILVTLILIGILAACSKPETPAPQTSAEVQQPTGLERIPDPDPTQYPKFHDMTDWRNPQLVVREDGIGLVDLANREIHILTPEQVPAELVSLPESAWPYGRVVLVTQAKPADNSEQAKVRLRENRGLL
ncbi:MAG: hypothetical protein HY233_13210, partial [Acidobacteriales bacterium]|nr:hypothetical protein [Candidatus Koribacter versatilis]MBI3646902.1 hypothetical protein [Terriglobales bacterium]